MVLVLVIGDLHIPQRAHDLPLKFKKLLIPGKIQKIICTGNITDKSTLDYLRSIAGDITVVKGDNDQDMQLPQTKVLQVGNVHIGIIHGHQIIPWGDDESLSITARQLEVDVLLTGHTHRLEVYENGGRFFVNPGSATGAYSSMNTDESIPSFVLMDIQASVVVTYVYKLINDEVKVEKIEFTKHLDANKIL
ncbi:hypothetical protein G6F46_002295 [Rhizopus delemar]|nr:hypothetical protein G6F55_002143 [Rhizopus delemar]KAG1554216.1 hypothetical protein G6F51_000081 [Rhizopus arrhizus]KAG1502819.1 hypothetical protein G6F54_002091 [Rhizopus delemar]KAG1511420.1 hypothetical protein G6F53_005951 [Rhizopus delemar]KAG1523171.1 hypothetical protein G6F52_005239 [Rhizopus delemar]